MTRMKRMKRVVTDFFNVFGFFVLSGSQDRFFIFLGDFQAVVYD